MVTIHCVSLANSVCKICIVRLDNMFGEIRYGNVCYQRMNSAINII